MTYPFFKFFSKMRKVKERGNKKNANILRACSNSFSSPIEKVNLGAEFVR